MRRKSKKKEIICAKYYKTSVYHPFSRILLPLPNDLMTYIYVRVFPIVVRKDADKTFFTGSHCGTEPLVATHPHVRADHISAVRFAAVNAAVICCGGTLKIEFFTET